jgi:predicted metal-dependent phosphoesterase TrpH
MGLREIFEEAKRRQIRLISITDHDSLDCQESAKNLAAEHGIQYICGLELNITFSHTEYRNGKPISLDFLAYQYDTSHTHLQQKLSELRAYRVDRAEQILEKINHELEKEHLERFSKQDLDEIQNSVDGSFGRPHIADYMVRKGLVTHRQEAFDKYLVKCNVPKMPLALSEASRLVRGAGGKLMLAHPSDPNGTSLISFTSSIREQQEIIRETMLDYIDGIECWHHRHDKATVAAYLAFAREMSLMVTGGSDCHQQPVIMGTVNVPAYVAEQFGFEITGD